MKLMVIFPKTLKIIKIKSDTPEIRNICLFYIEKQIESKVEKVKRVGKCWTFWKMENHLEPSPLN